MSKLLKILLCTALVYVLDGGGPFFWTVITCCAVFLTVTSVRRLFSTSNP